MNNIEQWIKETMESVWRGTGGSDGGGLAKWLYRQPIEPLRLRGPGYTRPVAGTRRKHGKQRGGK